MPRKVDKTICEAIWTWTEVMSKLSNEDFARAQGAFSQVVHKEDGSIEVRKMREPTPQAVLGNMRLWMQKSNLLWRLIYLQEPLRKDKCPRHNGHWSGCTIDSNYCDCQKVIVDGKVYVDMNITGWLLDGNPPVSGECGAVTFARGDWPRKVCKAISGHKGAHQWHVEHK